MAQAMNTTLVIPALNEADVIGRIVRRVPQGHVREVIVVDNGSSDATAAVAAQAGARGAGCSAPARSVRGCQRRRA